MKTLLILTAALLFSFSALAARDITCSKGLKGPSRPVSLDAQELTKMLKVKTCAGQRFKFAVKKAGLEISYVQPTEAQIERYGLRTVGEDGVNAFFAKNNNKKQ